MSTKHFSVRIPEDLLARIERLRERLPVSEGMRAPTSSDAARIALVRGLDVIEGEMEVNHG